MDGFQEPESDGQPGVHEPFTKAERMQQLSEIDRDITSLLEITSQALSSLVKLASPSSSDPSDPTKNATNGQDPAPASGLDAATSAGATTEQQSRAFESSTDAFFNTLLSVHVRLKRQILGLEEAGIITLRDAKAPAGSSLGPNGVGAIGSLDVGWLNSRTNKVERDMEAELWADVRRQLEAFRGHAAANGSTAGPGGSEGDVSKAG